MPRVLVIPARPCSICGGRGYLIVRVERDPLAPSGDNTTKQSGSPCPACGRSLVIDIAGVDVTTSWLEQTGRAHARRDRKLDP